MAASKPTAVHFSLIFFVMTTIILGVTTYIFLDDANEQRTKLAAASKSEQTQKNIAIQGKAVIDRLKQEIGHNNAEVGDPGNPENAPGTVLGEIANDKKIAGSMVPTANTLKDGIRSMRQAVDTAQNDLKATQAEKTALEARMKTLETQYVSDSKAYEKARDDAKQQLEDNIAEHEKAIALKQEELDKLRGEYNNLVVAKAQAEQTHQQEVAQLNERITRLIGVNNKLRDDFEKATRVSYERPDGEIQWIDNTARLVWINLGELDNLKERTTFSVYKQGHRGIGRDSKDEGRGPEDIKGSIEVVSVKGPHRAIARILEDDIYDPLAPGDPIYSPLWSPNQKEYFAFVGEIDIDDDGKSDRQLLHDTLKAAGAVIQLEVDDDGQVIGGPMDDRTKFLVIGHIPVLQQNAKQEEKDRINRIVLQHKKLREAAREQGTRILNLNDFMSFMGYVPKQRVFRPGDQRPFALRSGATSTTVDEVLGNNRASAGQTSGAFSKRLNKSTTGRPTRRFGSGY